MRVLRRHWPSIVALLVAAAIVPIAVADHHNKQARINRAEASEWYCTHLGERCGGPSSVTIEDDWNVRQVAYEAAFVALATVAVGSFAFRATSPRRRTDVVRRSSS
jgi:hypothetical protein